MALYPCRNCIYFKECGDNMRTIPCNGRKTKSEVKQEKKHENRLRKGVKQGTES